MYRKGGEEETKRRKGRRGRKGGEREREREREREKEGGEQRATEERG
jgi:hypothetical protein